MLLGARQECVAGGDSIAEKMSVLKELEYDFLELCPSPEEVDALGSDAAKEYRAEIERTGVPILSTSFGGFGGFAGRSPGERAEVVARVRKLVEFSAAIGADVVLLATSEPSPDVAAYAGVYRDELGPVADVARRAGVTLALEHVGSFKPATVFKLLEAIGHPAVRMYFDMGNCLYVAEDPIAQARACAGVTAQIHAKGGPTTPFGAMPLREVREGLEAGGYAGRCCLEIPATDRDLGLKEARGLLRMTGYLSTRK